MAQVEVTSSTRDIIQTPDPAQALNQGQCETTLALLQTLQQGQV